ncbi:MAG: 3-phosphoshikimate 1-carboxyvinyltransferase [Candidatus Omnitrophica bacterium]|nr:3-phosphoshikimate 1-carboxyvinyltransferase [Candidatus Omnitrophota bacterium]
MESVTVQKTLTPLSGSLAFPGDKSLSHRAIMFGSLADGVSEFTNVLAGEDCVRTRKAFEAMGVAIEGLSPTHLKIKGRGLRSLRAPKKELYLGNSGTSMRLLLGILAGFDFDAVLTGDPSLSSRPMRRVTDHLKAMGARIEGRQDGNFAPIKIHGGNLKAIDARLSIPSAQVKSALLLAGLYAEGQTSVTEPARSRDHTEKFLSYFGAPIEQKGLRVSVNGSAPGKGPLRAKSFEIPGDISSAAFFIALSILVPKSSIQFRSVLWNPTRTGLLAVLKRMGVDVRVDRLHAGGPEPAADFTLTRRALGAFEIEKNELPALIDEVPILAVLATQAEGTSIIHDAEELRVKETDRIHSMVTTLSQMGASIAAEGNSLVIKGPTPLHGAPVDSFRDHRTAMALVIAGLVAEGKTTVKDTECVRTSFPDFFELLKKCGTAIC